MRYARSLSNGALETLRWRAVEMVRGGATQVATRALGVHKNTVSLWLKWWREGGDAALKPKRRGPPWRLSAATEAAIQRMIAEKYPDQLKLPSALWTRMAVHALIATRFGIPLNYSTTVKCLHRWGLMPRGRLSARTPRSAAGSGRSIRRSRRAPRLSGPTSTGPKRPEYRTSLSMAATRSATPPA
jgi:transposase